MSWLEHHKKSETLASQAQAACRDGNYQQASDLYARAANAERLALNELDVSKARTLGISAVSAVSLYYKAADFSRAEQIAIQWLACDSLPPFAADHLRTLLQTIWSERVRDKSDAHFAPGQVLVSVKGGEIIEGGAPLDLIIDKVQTVQSLFYGTGGILRRTPPSTARSAG